MRARHTYREVFNIHTAPAGGDPFTIHLANRRFPVIYNIAVFLYETSSFFTKLSHKYRYILTQICSILGGGLGLRMVGKDLTKSLNGIR